MAYNTEELKATALKEIKKRRLIFIEDVVCYLPCTKPTFYEHKLNESSDIKAALHKNKTTIKTHLRSKWYNSDNATLQIALYRLSCTDEERKKLAINYTELTGKDGDKLFDSISDEDIERKLKSFRDEK